MSNLDFMKSIIGKPVFALPVGANHRGKCNLKPCVIESVGRKYVKASVSTHKYTVLKKDDHYLKSEYYYDFLIFESEKEYGDYKRAKDLRSKIGASFNYIGGAAEKLSLDQLERINEIINEGGLTMNKVNYALAPAGATHYEFFNNYVHWMRYENGWMYFDDSEWWHYEADSRPANEKEIPERERTLSRLADLFDEWPYKAYSLDGIHYSEWQQRRAGRIEAGLIEVDNPVTSSVTNSQAKEIELDMLKGENSEPEYTHEYSDYGVRNRCTIFCDDKDANGNIVVKNAYDEFVLVQAGNIWPIKTPEQKIRDAFLVNALALKPEELYTWVTDRGVDLTPIVEEQTSD